MYQRHAHVTQGSGYAGLSDFCDFTETRGGTFSPTDQGLATTESVDLAYEAWIAARSQWGVAFPMPEWSNLSFSLAWNYQVCTELCELGPVLFLSVQRLIRLFDSIFLRD